MPRQTDIKVQARALELAARGYLQKDIAKELGISERTIRRYLTAYKPGAGETQARLLVSPAPRKKKPKPEPKPEPLPKPITNPIEALECISSAKSDEPPIHLTFAQSTAMRLLTLTDKALTVIEETLDNPDAKRTDKLKAVQIVGGWVNIGYQRREHYNHKTIAGESSRALSTIFESPKPKSEPEATTLFEKRLALLENLKELWTRQLGGRLDIGLEQIKTMIEPDLDDWLKKTDEALGEEKGDSLYEEMMLEEAWKRAVSVPAHRFAKHCQPDPTTPTADFDDPDYDDPIDYDDPTDFDDPDIADYLNNPPPTFTNAASRARAKYLNRYDDPS